MNIERVYHIRPTVNGYQHGPVLTHGGATLIVQGNTEHLQLTVKVAWCNPTDVFSRKLGRETARMRDSARIIPLRALPGVLGKTWKEVHRRVHVKPTFRDQSQFDRCVLDFLPKVL